MAVDTDAASTPTQNFSLLGLAALGIVFGDIGTSPLYTFNTILGMIARTDPPVILGLLSLVLWTLFLITTVKYVCLAMQVDNDGEGGILALMALLGVKKHRRPLIVALGLVGAALIYGDGAITPAISVLSALEGLTLATSAFQPYIVPLAVAILLLLFVVQYQGTHRIGRAFGPVMLLWFAVIAAMGIGGIVRHPGVLMAVNPMYGIAFLMSHGVSAFLVLGGVFLCVTGAEALYADMGHFGRGPIQVSWFFVVFPSLILNYAGQAALVLDGAATGGNVFYLLCPPGLLIPTILLATCATVIASQSVITGAFSMTRQAISLGWLPRLNILQTHSGGYGQIYVPVVNAAMAAVTIGLTIGFGKSENLAATYGLAVSLTMLMTTGLHYIALREVLDWKFYTAAGVTAVFVIVDGTFFAANLTKIAQGGYVPLLLAALVYGVMWTWHKGAAALAARMREDAAPVGAFLEDIEAEGIPRVPGTAVFLTRMSKGVPAVMDWHVRMNRALHRHLVALQVVVPPVPWVAPSERITMKHVAPDFWRIEARYGFMERPQIPDLLRACHCLGCNVNIDDVTYYIGHETVISREDHRGLPRWQEALFALMERNAIHASDFFSLPPDQTVELGRQVAI